MSDPTDAVLALLRKADDLRKAAPSRAEPEAARERIVALLEDARTLLARVGDADQRQTLGAAVSRRFGDLDREALAPMLRPTADVAPAPTRVDDPSRVPPGQHLTAGWPVLHVGRMPDVDPAAWRCTVTGRVHRRTVYDLAGLAALGTVEVTADLHCVTGWSRLDNTWTGVRVRDVLAAAEPRPEATHVIVTGAPAYSATVDLATLQRDEVLLAWSHDRTPLSAAHGGPLRLVVPSRYGWKSVKWVTELRLVDRDVPGYWEERGYHAVGDPWREQRFHGD